MVRKGCYHGPKRPRPRGAGPPRGRFWLLSTRNDHVLGLARVGRMLRAHGGRDGGLREVPALGRRRLQPLDLVDRCRVVPTRPRNGSRAKRSGGSPHPRTRRLPALRVEGEDREAARRPASVARPEPRDRGAYDRDLRDEILGTRRAIAAAYPHPLLAMTTPSAPSWATSARNWSRASFPSPSISGRGQGPLPAAPRWVSGDPHVPGAPGDFAEGPRGSAFRGGPPVTACPSPRLVRRRG